MNSPLNDRATAVLRFADVDVFVYGPQSAPPLVLIHGLGGSHATWQPVIDQLRANFRIVAVDLPGGRSIEREAEGLDACLQAMNVEQAQVCGHSFGGLVATALAEHSPATVGRLVVVNSPPTVESRLGSQSARETILRTPILGQLAWTMAGRKRLRDGLRTAFRPGAPVPDQFVDDLQKTGHSAFIGSSSAIDTYLHAETLPDRLARLDIPTHVVFGVLDQRVHPDSLDAYTDIPNVAIVRLPDAGHTPPWESPDQMAELIARPAKPPQHDQHSRPRAHQPSRSNHD
jgi:pimeloyl-ACP methyl ester carboxylesterase